MHTRARSSRPRLVIPSTRATVAKRPDLLLRGLPAFVAPALEHARMSRSDRSCLLCLACLACLASLAAPSPSTRTDGRSPKQPLCFVAFLPSWLPFRAHTCRAKPEALAVLGALGVLGGSVSEHTHRRAKPETASLLRGLPAFVAPALEHARMSRSDRSCLLCLACLASLAAPSPSTRTDGRSPKQPLCFVAFLPSWLPFRAHACRAKPEALAVLGALGVLGALAVRSPGTE